MPFGMSAVEVIEWAGHAVVTSHTQVVAELLDTFLHDQPAARKR